MTSGSSIMPQKKNVDIAELLKSKVHVVLGLYTQLIGISGNLPSGYNRDVQDTKRPMIESLDSTLKSIQVTHVLLNHLTPNEETLKRSMSSDLFATHTVFDLVKQGMTFRDAYTYVGNHIGDVSHEDVSTSLKQSTHIGGTGNLGFSVFEKEIKKYKTLFQKEHASFIGHIEKLDYCGKEVKKV
jgi:argininosuccinate lyase